MDERMTIIDAHLHIKDELEYSLSDIYTMMRQIAQVNHYDRHTLLSLPATDEEHLLQNLLCMHYKLQYPEDVYIFGSLSYHLPAGVPNHGDFLKQAKCWMDIGFDGIKLIESKPSRRKNAKSKPYSDACYEPMFAWLEKTGTPILWHVADPEEFWDINLAPEWSHAHGWFYGDGTFPTKEDFYTEVDTMLERHPGLRIVFAHMYFLSADLERADRFLTKWPQVSFDFTPGSEMYDNFFPRNQEWRDVFLRHQDQLIFGTDAGWPTGCGMQKKVEDSERIVNGVLTYLETTNELQLGKTVVRGIALPHDVVEKILWKNFLRYVGDPKPLNLGRALEYISAFEGAVRLDDNLKNKQAFLDRIGQMAKDFQSALQAK